MRKNSKLAVLVFALALAVAGAGAQSPDSNSAPAPQAQDAQGGAPGMHGDHPGRRMDWLAKQLNLTDDQKTKLQPIFENEASQMRAVRDDTSLNPDQRRAKMKQIRESTRPQIDAVLTPEQQQKFQQLQEQRRHHHGRMDQGGTPQ